MTTVKRTLIGLKVVFILACIRAQNAATTVSANSLNNGIGFSSPTHSATSLINPGTAVENSITHGTSNNNSSISGISVSNSTESVSDSNNSTNPVAVTNTRPTTLTEMFNSTSIESQNHSNNTATIQSTTSQSTDQESSKHPPDVIPTLINKTVSIPLHVRFVNANFSQDLANTTTKAYNETYTLYYTILYKVYVNVTGFQGIKITKFSSGSLIVDYNTTFGFDQQKNNEFYLLAELRNATDKLKSVPGVDNDTLALKSISQDDLGDLLCDAMQCPSGSICQHNEKVSPHILCVPKCDLKCQNKGECILNSDFKPVCRCPTKDGFIYGGNTCEQKAEMLEMSKENIIAISAGAGGGVILILLIIIMVVCCTKSSKVVKTVDNVKDDASEQSFKSMKDSEDGLHQAYNGKVTQAVSEPSFRRSDSKVSQQLGKEPYVVSSASMQPNTRNPRDIVDSYADYRYQGPRNPVENMEMRRQSRVRVADDIEINPDYGRFSSKARDSIDIGSPYRKNSTFNYLAQRRRSSAPVDWRGNRVTQNPLFTVPANRRKSSVYMEIDDNDSKSVMYQPANNLDQPTRRGSSINTIDNPLRQGQQQAKVYDYYNRKESVASAIYPRPRVASNADLYDFDEESNAIRSVYGVRRAQQGPTSPRRF